MCFFKKRRERKKQIEAQSRAAMLDISGDDGPTVGQWNIPDEDDHTLNMDEDDDKTVQLNYSANQVKARTIILTDEQNKNKFFKAAIRQSVVIGKEPNSCAIVIPDDKAVSRCHCKIELMNDKYVISDGFAGNKSTNGTFVNGMQITENTYIKPGDVITIGRGRYVFSEE